MAAPALPALPTDSNMTGPNVGQEGGPASSPFSGGLPGMMQAMQQIEQGYQMLVSALPSLAPIAAEGISKLRMAIPNAVGAVAQGPGAPGGGVAPPAGSAQTLPAPPAESAA